MFEDKSTNFMYGQTYFKWGHYFLFMLLGSIIGVYGDNMKFNFAWDFLRLAGCIILYYAILYCISLSKTVAQIQIISLAPLLGIALYFYKVCNSEILSLAYRNKISGWILKCISTLTLEIYLVQGIFPSINMRNIFPFNILIMFLIIVTGAYCIKVASRLFSQTFSDDKYNWYNMFKI
jgi:hypothetical protein